MTGALIGGGTNTTARTAGEASRLDVFGERAATVGVGLLIVTGFASSYTTLRDLAVDVGGFSPWLAPVVPLSFDLGIVVLSLKAILAARSGRDARVLRALVLMLSATTVVANGAASSTAVGRLLHAVPPAMFVVCFEALTVSARHDTNTGRTPARLDARGAGEALPVLTTARWLLAPRQTWAIWRARVLAVTPSALTTQAAAPPMPRSAARVAPARSFLGHLAAEASADEPPDTSPGGLANEPSEPSAVIDTGIAQPLAPAAHRSPAVRADVTPAGQRDRLVIAVEALRADPAMTAVALAEHLSGAGHPVSVRTAQRTRHQAEQQLAARPPDALLPGDHEGRSA